MEEKTKESERGTGGQTLAGGERYVYLMPSEGMTDFARDQLSFLEIWRLLWRGKWLVAGITALFAIVGLTYALFATEWYRAEVVLAPVDEKSRLGLANQLGGLASLAGIGTGADANVEPVAVLGSREFARELVEDLNLSVVFFADEWNPSEKRWRAGNPGEWPDVRDAVIYFDEEVRRVRQDRRTGLVTLTIDWTDPEMASQWANLLVKRVNDKMRARALIESERNVRYLQKEMASTKVVSLQQSIGRLLESESEKLMLARGNEEFSFHVVDRAEPPKYRENPKRVLIVLLFAIAGGFVSLIALLVNSSWARGSTPVRSS